MAHIAFLRGDFASMVVKRQRVVLPYLVDKELPVPSLSPSGGKEDWYRWSRWFGDYSY